MKIEYPSVEFDDAVAAVCHGRASDDQVRALGALLRDSSAARDEYILRLELHSRLASDSELFVTQTAEASPRRSWLRAGKRSAFWAAAAVLAVVATIAWNSWSGRTSPPAVPTSRAVAMLNETAGVRWAAPEDRPRSGAPLEPGWLKLEAGLAEVVFYSGARLVIQGPAELRLISASQVFCVRGKITAEVPAQARGFQIDTPQGNVIDLGTAFGLEVDDRRTEVHVFKGEVMVQTDAARAVDNVHEGIGVVLERSRGARRIAVNPDAFASLSELQAKSHEAGAMRLHQWRAAAARLNEDPSLLAHFAFDDVGSSGWQLRNASAQNALTGDATIVGCQWSEGRWPGKRALAFQSINDRVRMNVPGEFEALTLAAWVRVQGLDRKLNSLFMSDGFAAGSVHWLVRNDGVIGLTVVGHSPGQFQILTSPVALTLDRFGQWLHLAVVLDGCTGRVVHYVNGRQIGESELRIKPPYRIGTAELGNWNAKGFPENDPLMIRNFSGAMDEFCLFRRVFDPQEIRALYVQGRPEGDVMASRE